MLEQGVRNASLMLTFNRYASRLAHSKPLSRFGGLGVFVLPHESSNID
jgi:hypothetical protein